MRRKFLIGIGVVVSIVIAFFFYRSTITPLPGTTFRIYGKDVLGFIYRIETSCGIIGSCSYSYVFLGEHSSNFNIVKRSECNFAYGKYIYSNGRKLSFTDFERIGNSEYLSTDTGIYYKCGFQKVELDQNSAKVVNNFCAVDDKNVFCYGKYFDDLDPKKTFFVNEYFAVMDDTVWSLLKPGPVENLDGSTFNYLRREITGEFILQDENGTYKYDWTKSSGALTKIDEGDTMFSSEGQ